MHSKSKEAVLSMLGADAKAGLKSEEIALRRAKYGTNVIGKTKRKSLIMRVLEAFLDPMLLILCFALAITLGVNIGKLLKTGDGDFVECVGIFCAVVISVSITVCMEGRSERAFELLNEISDKALVKVIRDGGIRLIAQSEVVVGDVILLESGNRIVSDGRLIDSHGLSVDESALTGESLSVNKNAQAVVKRSAPLAERVNFVFAGTVVSAGSGRMVVTAVGDSAEIGKIAGELQRKSRISAPLGEKLARLGRGVTAVGAVAAVTVFVVSLIRMLVSGTATFQSVQELFIESVVLIVAAVPEGLPTIVALSLSVNVVRLARENVLIKKLVAAETVGCVSVICSDKTGTLTENKMTVEAIHSAPALTRCVSRVIEENIAVNTTADFMIDGDKRVIVGSPTEAALVRFLTKGNADVLVKIRGDIAVVEREEFTSEKKYMSTKTRKNGTFITYYKGAPEKIIELCRLGREDAERIRKRMRQYAQSSRRLIAFAHGDDSAVCFDGFAALSDPVRGDVKALVKRCKNAGIKVKMLTGDNAETAFAIARECGIATSRREVVNAHDTERLSDEAMLKLLKGTSVIARSTPLVKLRAVRLLMQNGDVVAVTGDGINDAPAIKQADIGIAMGS
ncbi:MAG: cation-transporting P-type ATPase, partial [Clostridia bacterium]|nr:cation-transporting P-type ATPase [Clostridia bacterium]